MPARIGPLWALFIGFVVGVLLLRREESRLTRARLGEYAAAGWFSASEVEMLATARGRRQALAWARTHLLARSASSLRMAVKAIRAPLAAQIRTELPRLETQYLEELMATADAIEGLQAFLDKRPPKYQGR